MSRKFQHNLLWVVLIATGLVAGGQAHAQQLMDYGKLEDIFGEPVTTSATGTPQRASDVAADMTIITADQIRRAGTRDIPLIIGMYTPGVNVMQENIDDFDIGMRGYNQPSNSQLLVLIDGRQVFNDDYSRTTWQNLPVNVDDIRQIEVVKGASSALFGSNATSGVINIITYSPLYDDNNVVSLTGGTQNGWTADGTITHKIGNSLGVKFTAGGLNEAEFSEKYKNPPEDVGATLKSHHTYVNASGVFKATPDLTFNSEATYSESYSEEAILLRSEYPVDTTTYSVRGGFGWKSPIGYIRNDNYMNQNNLEYHLLNYPIISDYPKNNLFVSHLEDQFEIGSDHTFRAMVEYRHKDSSIISTPYVVYEKPNLLEDVYTLGGTWLWQINDKLSWTNAGRVDNNHMDLEGTIRPGAAYPMSAYNRVFDTFALNSGLVYKPTDLDTFRLTYGRGVQNPSLVEAGFDTNYNDPAIAGVVFELQGNPTIKPEVATNYELGYDRKLPEADSTARVSAFYQSFRDMSAPVPATSQVIAPNLWFTVAEQNVGGSHSMGTEFDINGHNSYGFLWDASYSFAFVHDDASLINVIGNEGSSPEHQLRLSLGYSTGNWEFDVHNQYSTSTSMLRQLSTGDPALRPVGIAGFYSLGARVGYKIDDNFSVSLYGNNLTQDTTIVSPYSVIERRVAFGLTGKF